MFSKGRDEHLSGSLNNLGAGDHEGIALLAFFPGGNCLLDAQGFSGHGGLISADIVAFEEEAVNGDDLSGLDNLNISHQQVVNVDVADLVATDNIHVLAGCNCV